MEKLPVVVSVPNRSQTTNHEALCDSPFDFAQGDISLLTFRVNIVSAEA